MKIMAFKGFGNIETFSVSKVGELFDLSAAGFTSARVYAGDQHVEAIISGSDVKVVLGGLQVGVGCYDGKVVVYSELYSDGLVIMGQGLLEPLEITVKE
jgi:hypothetical protein